MDANEIHENIDDWTAALDAGGLSPEEQAALREHVSGCRECREVLEESHLVTEAVGTALSADRPGADFEDRMVEAFRKNVDAPAFQAARPPASRRILLRLAGAAALLALALGAGVMSLNLKSSEPAAGDQSRSVAVWEQKGITGYKNYEREASKEKFGESEMAEEISRELAMERAKRFLGDEKEHAAGFGAAALAGSGATPPPTPAPAWSRPGELRKFIEAIGRAKRDLGDIGAGKGQGGGGKDASKRGEAERLRSEVKRLEVAQALLVLKDADKKKGHRGRFEGETERTKWNSGGVRFASDTPGTESYKDVKDNPFKKVSAEPRSTLSIDVDTASYANVRRFLNANQFPPRGAVRIEELINYFTYDYPPPVTGEPFAVHLEVARCPWDLSHRLVRVGLKGKEMNKDEKPPSNLVFLIDVSGSMRAGDKLPLLQQSMKLLVDNLTEDDYVSIVVYASNARVVLPSTCARPKADLIASIDGLRAGGSTNGGAGIQWAYDQAKANFVKGGVNRVILCTDGDFNVGTTDSDALVRLLRERAKEGIFLSVLGFGTGNYKDARMEALADKGNGNYAYIDSMAEARKVLVEGMTGTLVTIAKDVKIQVEFNPVAVGAWRLIGYENRILQHRDFADDKKDAGEIGAGHTVTALYEIVPVGAVKQENTVEGLKYQDPPRPNAAAYEGELLSLKLRYKKPEADVSTEMEFAVMDSVVPFSSASDDFRFASVVAAFGMLLRHSPHRGSATYSGVAELASEGVGNDPKGRRAEFVGLVRKAAGLELAARPHKRAAHEREAAESARGR